MLKGVNLLMLAIFRRWKKADLHMVLICKSMIITVSNQAPMLLSELVVYIYYQIQQGWSLAELMVCDGLVEQCTWFYHN